MGVQMNIKSAEARALAEKIAKAKGVSLTEAIVESLRDSERALAKEDKKAWMAEFLAESRRLNAGRVHEKDPTAFLYDEMGLPK
ncbi:MAG: hypothetical protein RLZZ366_1254 [Pseudomonadota bacterium]|jgi:hypothetical protein